MTRRRKTLTLVAAVLLSLAAGVVGYGLYVVRHLPEAYVAWDAGKVLTAYLDRTDGRWPASWTDLEAAWTAGEQDEQQLGFIGDPETRARRLREIKAWVRIDWTFNPARPEAARPVTTPSGGPFRITFKGTEPNEMVREWIKTRPATTPSSTPIR